MYRKLRLILTKCVTMLRITHCNYFFLCISFDREEGEKLNVWVAWMNLENLYGSHEQLMKVFESALQQNEPIDVFMRLEAIYEQSNKMEVSSEIVI